MAADEVKATDYEAIANHWVRSVQICAVLAREFFLDVAAGI